MMTAAQAIMSGACDVVVACGTESMTRVPMGASFMHGPGKAFGPMMMARYNNFPFNQGTSAELIAFRVGRSLRTVSVTTRRMKVLATAAHTPIGLSLEGNRLAWAENAGGQYWIRALYVTGKG